MRTSYILLLILFVSTNFAFSQTPNWDFLANLQPYTCRNAQDMLKQANTDTSKLTAFASGDLLKAVSNAQTTADLVSQVCAISVNFRSSFIQTSSTSALRALSQKLRLYEDTSDLYQLFIADKFREVSSSLAQVTSQMATGFSQGLTFDAVCGDAKTKSVNLKNYINQLSDKVNDLIRNTLPKRITDLNQFIAECTFLLPNLGINEEAFACPTGQQQLKKAQDDLTKITNFYKGGLNDANTNVQQIQLLINQACAVQNTFGALKGTFLESHSSSQAFDAIIDDMEPQEQSDLYKLLIADKFKDLTSAFAEINSASLLTQDVTLDSICSNARAKVQNLIYYLGWLRTQLDGKMTILNARNTDFTRLIVECTFAAPDFGVSKDPINCQNAQGFLDKANGAINKVQGFLNRDIDGVSNNVNLILQSLRQACQISSTFSKLRATLLQMRSSSKASSTSRAFATFETDVERLASTQGETSLYDSLIGDKVNEVSASLLTITASLGQDAGAQVDALCTDAITKTQNLAYYLGYLKRLIPNAIQTDIPARITALNAKVASCAIITATGQYSYPYNAQSNLGSSVANAKTEDITVQFGQVFAAPPSFGVALTGLGLNSIPGIKFDVISTTTTAATVRVSMPPYASTSLIQFGWIATLSEKSGIYIVNNDISSADNIPTQAGARTISKAVAVPGNLKNVKSLALIRGFTFNKGSNIKLIVATSGDSSKVNYGVWGDSVLTSASTTVIYYSGDDYTTDMKFNVQPTPQALAKAPIGRSTSMDISNYASQPLAFFGYYQIDISGAANASYKVDQGINNNAVTYGPSDTTINSIRSGIILTCPTPDKDSCRRPAGNRPNIGPPPAAATNGNTV